MPSKSVLIASTATPTNNTDHYTQADLWENLPVKKIIFEEDSA